MKGMLALLAFAVLSAGRDVVAREHFTQHNLHPVYLTWLFCTVTWVFFYGVACVRKRGVYRFTDLRTRSRNEHKTILWFNVGTLVAYLTTFLAIGKIDAYANSIVDYGAAPVLTAVLAMTIRSERINRAEASGMGLSVIGIVVLGLALAGGSTVISPRDATLGLLYAGISCFFTACNNVWNKQVVEMGIVREHAILVRLPLAIFFLGAWLLLSSPAPTTAGFVQLTILGLLGMAIPLYAIVYAFETLQVKHLAFALFLVPVFTYFGSLAHGHIGSFGTGRDVVYALAGVLVVVGVAVSERGSATTLRKSEPAEAG